MNISIFNKLINIGVDQENDQTEIAQKTKTINILCLYAIVGLFAFSLLNIRLGFFDLVIVDFVISFLSLVSVYLNYKRQYDKSKILLFVVGPLLFLYFPVFVGNVGNQYYNIMFLTIGIYVFNDKKNIIYYTIYIACLHAITIYLTTYSTYNEKYKILEPINEVPSLVTAIVVIIVIVLMFKFDTIKYQKKINQQKDELEKKVAELAVKNELANSLLKELNHRVKNNLQLVSSLFIMQSYKTTDAHTKQALDEARNRIDTVALMHQRLYKENKELQTNLNLYIRELANYVLQSSGQIDETTIAIDDITLSMEDTLHIGLIVNELLTNILKYGIHTETNKTKVWISIASNENQVTISIRDNGQGFPESFSIDNTKSFGLELVRAIVLQHDGTFNFSNKQGASIELTLTINSIKNAMSFS